MQQIQYNTENRMHVLQNFSGGETPGSPFGAGTQNQARLQNLGCAPGYVVFLLQNNDISKV